MPLYDFECNICGLREEVYGMIGVSPPICCGQPMKRMYGMGTMIIKEGIPLFVRRIEDIQKAQKDRGERTQFVHPGRVVRA